MKKLILLAFVVMMATSCWLDISPPSIIGTWTDDDHQLVISHGGTGSWTGSDGSPVKITWISTDDDQSAYIKNAWRNDIMGTVAVDGSGVVFNQWSTYFDRAYDTKVWLY